MELFLKFRIFIFSGSTGKKQPLPNATLVIQTLQTPFLTKYRILQNIELLDFL